MGRVQVLACSGEKPFGDRLLHRGSPLKCLAAQTAAVERQQQARQQQQQQRQYTAGTCGVPGTAADYRGYCFNSAP
jgi:hypothetical protein